MSPEDTLRLLLFLGTIGTGIYFVSKEKGTTGEDKIGGCVVGLVIGFIVSLIVVWIISLVFRIGQ